MSTTPSGKRKRANYDIDTRNLLKRIILKYNSGTTPKQLSDIYKISASTISGIVSKKSQEKVSKVVIDTASLILFLLSIFSFSTLK